MPVGSELRRSRDLHAPAVRPSGTLNDVYYAYRDAAQRALDGVPEDEYKRDLFAALRKIIDAEER